MDGENKQGHSHGTGVRKAATLLIGLGPKAASSVFKELNDNLLAGDYPYLREGDTIE